MGLRLRWSVRVYLMLPSLAMVAWPLYIYSDIVPLFYHFIFLSLIDRIASC